MNHRKHVHEWEIDPVAETLREHLTEMVPLHDQRDILPGEIVEQFHVLYRFENNRVGKPAYPTPETWGTLATYLGVMIPSSILESIQGHPEQPKISPENQTAAPGILENQCPNCGAISPNPRYCTGCGKAMEVIQ